METKANYTMVGAFVLGSIILVIVFLVWVVGSGFHEKTRSLNVIFTRVSGLKEGNSVYYQGLYVGKVETISLNKKTKRLIVKTSLDANVPLKEDTAASIEFQGLTGSSYIQLSGGSETSPDLPFDERNPPTIIGTDSTMDRMMGEAPTVLHGLNALTSNMREIVSEQNKEALEEILANIKEITESLSSEGEHGVNFGEELTGLIQDFREAALEITSTAKEIRSTAKEVAPAIKEVATTIKQFTSTAKELELTAKEIRGVFSENRQAIKSFAGIGLSSITKAVVELRDTFSVLKRVLQDIERSPIRFLYNDPERGVKLK